MHIYPHTLPKKIKNEKKIKVSFACLCVPFFHLIHTPLSCGSVAWILPGPSGFPWRELRSHGSRRRWKKSLRFCFSSLPEVVVLGRQPLPIIADTGSIIRPCHPWFSAEAEMRSVVEPPDRLHTLCNASCYAASSKGSFQKHISHYLGDFAGHVCHPISVKVANTMCGGGKKKKKQKKHADEFTAPQRFRNSKLTFFWVPMSPGCCVACRQGITRDPSPGSSLTVWVFICVPKQML